MIAASTASQPRRLARRRRATRAGKFEPNGIGLGSLSGGKISTRLGMSAGGFSRHAWLHLAQRTVRPSPPNAVGSIR